MADGLPCCAVLYHPDARPSHHHTRPPQATAFENGRLVDAPSVATAMLACTPLSLGPSAREALQDFLGEERVMSAYSSREEDAACFVISASYKESQDLKLRRIVEDITVFPASARLAEGTLSYKASLDRFDETGVHPHSPMSNDELELRGVLPTSSESETKKRKEHPVFMTARAEHKRTPMALSHHLLDHHAPALRLVLAPGLGASSAGAGKRMVQSWLEALDSGAAHDGLERDFFWSQSLNQDHPLEVPAEHPHGRTWTHAINRARTMRAAAAAAEAEPDAVQCSYAGVSIEEIEGTKGHFSLTGLETLALTAAKRDELKQGNKQGAKKDKTRLIERTAEVADERDACWLTLLAQLSSRPEVLLVAPKPEVKPHNYFAARITQGGSYDAETTFWDLGVNGSTQVVGCADTGIDENSCLFYDDVNGHVTRTKKGGSSKVGATADSHPRYDRPRRPRRPRRPYYPHCPPPPAHTQTPQGHDGPAQGHPVRQVRRR